MWKHYQMKKNVQHYLNENDEIAKLVRSGDTEKIHLQAQLYLEKDEPAQAWKLLLANR